jgi:hypothetical protein
VPQALTIQPFGAFLVFQPRCHILAAGPKRTWVAAIWLPNRDQAEKNAV